MKIVKPSVELIWITPCAKQVIEEAGRTCYRSEDMITEESAAKFVRMLKDRHHESVLEHASASFRVVCDRGVMAELTRHRLASFSVESTRYCNYSKDKFDGEITVVQPPGLCPERESVWYDACVYAERAYFQMLEKGLPPQIARSVLPTCLKTELVVTANLREWMHILKLRTDKAAHPQMREIAETIKEILVKRCPAVFEDEPLPAVQSRGLKEYAKVAETKETT